MVRRRSIATALGLFGWVIAAAAAAAAAGLQALPGPLPAGSTLPVVLERTLDAGHVPVGGQVRARLSQRVPLAEHEYLPQGTELLGTIVAASPTQLSIAWTELRRHGSTEPVSVTLVAAAEWLDVSATHDPLGGPTFSTSDWVTEQIGGDEIYGANVATDVYDRYSRKVGRADGTGVYAPPLAPGLPERAMGPFSTTAKGLYDLPALAIVSPGGPGLMVLAIRDAHWRLREGSALLLSVVVQ